MVDNNDAERSSKPKKKREVKGRRALSIFPTDIGSLEMGEVAKLSFKTNGMADQVLQALQKHGVEAGDKRKKVIEQVKAKFASAADPTIRTQVYRGIVYLREVPHP
ncbi:MAG TPA: hypothetical protein VGS11_10980 [Candidatus Bathyarchaeia archaeon]|nr:hypothetical protein [Candidatus Bathyarchaeia archaeon]